MAKPEFDYERCLVCVRRGGQAVGTGFVIGPGRVLTCAHVVAQESGKRRGGKPIEVEFFASESSETRRRVTIDSRFFSPESRSDIAVLTWEGELPSGVKQGVLSSKYALTGTSVRTRGFPQLGKYVSHPGEGKIIGEATQFGRESDWSLSSDQIQGGFSGAPLFESNSGLIVGMVCSIARPDEDWRNSTTAFAVSCQSIRSVCGELFKAQDEAVEREHQAAVGRLKKELIRLLQGSRAALNELATAFGLSTSDSPSGLADRAASKLIGDPSTASISGQMTVTDLVVLLIPLYEKLLKRNNHQAANCLLDVYLAVLSAILDPGLVKSLRGAALHGERTLVVPASTRTIVGVIMAGLDGRLGDFHPPTEPGSDPRSKREIPLPPERGYSKTRQGDASGEIDHAAILTSIENGLDIDLGHLTPDVRLQRLRSILKIKEKSDARVFVVSDHAKPADSTVWRHLRDCFPYLYLVDMTKPGEAELARDSDAMALLSICHFGRVKTTKPTKRRPR